MFTKHGFKRGHYIPLVFCLLPCKSQEIYNILFKLISNKCNEYNFNLYPKNVIIDFEVGIHNAVSETWINTNIIGCRFHLSQAWYRKIQTLGLSNDYKNNTEIGKRLKYFLVFSF